MEPIPEVINSIKPSEYTTNDDKRNAIKTSLLLSYLTLVCD